MRKVIVASVLALAVPSLALAAKPPAPGTSQAAAAPKVTYVLKGALQAFTAANGSTPGSVQILVRSANYHGSPLKSKTLTFAVTTATKVVTKNHAAVTVGDRGVVKVRYSKKLAAGLDLATELQKQPATQVIDQGPSS